MAVLTIPVIYDTLLNGLAYEYAFEQYTRATSLRIDSPPARSQWAVPVPFINPLRDHIIYIILIKSMIDWWIVWFSQRRAQHWLHPWLWRWCNLQYFNLEPTIFSTIFSACTLCLVKALILEEMHRWRSQTFRRDEEVKHSDFFDPSLIGSFSWNR